MHYQFFTKHATVSSIRQCRIVRFNLQDGLYIYKSSTAKSSNYDDDDEQDLTILKPKQGTIPGKQWTARAKASSGHCSC